MLRKKNVATRYHFKNENNHILHYVDVNYELTEDEQKILGQILAYFPTASSPSGWVKQFDLINFDKFPKNYLLLL